MDIGIGIRYMIYISKRLTDIFRDTLLLSAPILFALFIILGFTAIIGVFSFGLLITLLILVPFIGMCLVYTNISWLSTVAVAYNRNVYICNMTEEKFITDAKSKYLISCIGNPEESYYDWVSTVLNHEFIHLIFDDIIDKIDVMKCHKMLDWLDYRKWWKEDD